MCVPGMLKASRKESIQNKFFSYLFTRENAGL